tara:strand:- start:63129 stop:63686 length:558 start_codon:yes stop_codon:yes gene_type:complete
MLEERLFLILGYVLLSAIFATFLFYTRFSKLIKFCLITVVSIFYFLTWWGYSNILGWPSDSDLPENFRISWVVIEEPNKTTKEEGHIYLWIRQLDEAKLVFGKPRSYELTWTEENNRTAKAALLRIEQGERLNGTKTYGVLDSSNQGDKANPYQSFEGEEEVGIPSFEFKEVVPPNLPPKAQILE